MKHTLKEKDQQLSDIAFTSLMIIIVLTFFIIITAMSFPTHKEILTGLDCYDFNQSKIEGATCSKTIIVAEEYTPVQISVMVSSLIGIIVMIAFLIMALEKRN